MFQLVQYTTHYVVCDLSGRRISPLLASEVEAHTYASLNFPGYPAVIQAVHSNPIVHALHGG
jgi:hypothetical protein